MELKTISDFLDKEIEVTRRINKSLVVSKMTIKERFAELAVVNQGSTNVKQFGTVIPAGPYGRTGLTVEEAFEFTHIVGMFSGIVEVYGEEAKRDGLEKIQLEIIKVKMNGFDPKKNLISEESCDEDRIQIYSESDLKALDKVHKQTETKFLKEGPVQFRL